MVDAVTSWRPTATREHLHCRSKLLTEIRQFFLEKNVLEVDTPLMAPATITSPAIESIPATYSIDKKNYTLYLQTSPEFYMKRLLAAGSGSIYQICKAFRQGESGRLHNPEFTMLEWYRPGFDHHDLMTEMTELFQLLLVIDSVQRISYEELFLKSLHINPHLATIEELIVVAQKNNLNYQNEADKDDWLNLLLTHCIEPTLSGLTFIYDYPETQAALAKTRHEKNYKVAERFEAYIGSIELANGFHELADAKEQQARFEQELVEREKLGLPLVPIDNALLDALAFGFPDCAGVAVGIDRLVMLALKQQSIASVMSFVTEF